MWKIPNCFLKKDNQVEPSWMTFQRTRNLWAVISYYQLRILALSLYNQNVCPHKHKIRQGILFRVLSVKFRVLTTSFLNIPLYIIPSKSSSLKQALSMSFFIQHFIYTGHTQTNGAVLIVNTIKTAPFFCVCPVYIKCWTKKHTQKNGAVLIVNTIKTVPFFCVCPV